MDYNLEKKQLNQAHNKDLQMNANKDWLFITSCNRWANKQLLKLL